MRNSLPDPHVAILLSTWNGAAHLPQQLASFAEQRGVEWRLYWRDDGSEDGTAALLAAFAAAWPDRVVDCNDARGRIGITASFLALLRRVPAGTVAFADQDDVWLPEKLARGAAALAAGAADTPALYCARQMLVDAELNPLRRSPGLGTQPGFPRALTQNIATGCTVMLNPAAHLLVASTREPPGTLHDWWAYIVVAAAGGRVVLDDEPAVLYRQHGHNAVGVSASTWSRGVAALRRGPSGFMRVFRAHVQALREQPGLLAPASRDALDRIAVGLERGPVPRLRILADPRLRRQSVAETLLFRLWFLLG